MAQPGRPFGPRLSVTVLLHLPVTYNPDRHGRRRRVEPHKHQQTAEEIATLFEAGGFLHEPGKGFWHDRGVVDRDDMAILEADLPDTPRVRRALVRYVKRVLLRRFRQKAIYVKFVHAIESLTITTETVVR